MKQTPYALTPAASKGNAFSRHLNGVPSVFLHSRSMAEYISSQSATAAIEKARAEGVEPFKFHGLSIKSDERIRKVKAVLVDNKKSRFNNIALAGQKDADDQARIKGK